LNTLHIYLGLQWRGGENRALLVIQGLRARGHVAELVAVRESPLAKRAQAGGVRVHAVGRSGARFRAVLRLRKLLRDGRFDIVHCHDPHGLTTAWLAGVHRYARLVAFRSVAYPIAQNLFALARYRQADRIIAVSRFVRESVLASGLPSERVEVIYDGVQVPHLPTQQEGLEARRRWDVPDSSDLPLLGCVGYLLPEKGQESLIRALPIVQKQYQDCHLLLAGDGPCRAGLERLALELGVERAVQLAGVVDDVSQVYQALDVFLFPSLAEPLGSSLLSAMAYGLPVVAVAGGAVPEVIEDGRNGLLVHTPEPSSIAAAVLRLLHDPSLSARLGIAARKTIEERFSADRMAQETSDLYQRVCIQRGQPG
jgi:glycosyltransferase involved in cell wall biosynthesis